MIPFPRRRVRLLQTTLHYLHPFLFFSSPFEFFLHFLLFSFPPIIQKNHMLKAFGVAKVLDVPRMCPELIRSGEEGGHQRTHSTATSLWCASGRFEGPLRLFPDVRRHRGAGAPERLRTTLKFQVPPPRPTHPGTVMQRYSHHLLSLWAKCLFFCAGKVCLCACDAIHF